MKEYYLCSASVVEANPQFESSKPFISGYDYDTDVYYIIYADFDVLESNYHSNLLSDYWLNECVPGTMDTSKITFKDVKKYGLFLTIERAIGLTKESNRAMCIYNLANQNGLTPIEYINKITSI